MSYQSYLICGSIMLLLFIVSFIIVRKQQQLITRFKLLGIDSRNFRKRYLDFVHLLPQTVIELDSSAKITSLNTAGFEFLGLNKYDLKRGVSLKQMIVEDQQERFEQDLRYVLEGGLNKGQEYILETPQGSSYDIIIYFNPMVNLNERDGIRGIIIDASHSKRMERKAFRAVIETEERERKRYSEDLHDGLGPLLSTIKLYINQMHKLDANAKESEEMLIFSNDLIDEAINTTKTIANNILPSSISDNGLWSAIEAFCQPIEQTGTMSFILVNNTDLKFKKKAANNIYRILIELVNNSLKHAHAKLISISFEMVNEKLRIVYSDDGSGIKDVKHKGLGISNIKNRSQSLNGQYRFINDSGMRFELFLPLSEIVE